MTSTLISAILWTLCSICFATLAIVTFISGGVIWLGALQAFAAVVDGISAGLNWKLWKLEKEWNEN